LRANHEAWQVAVIATALGRLGGCWLRGRDMGSCGSGSGSVWDVDYLDLGWSCRFVTGHGGGGRGRMYRGRLLLAALCVLALPERGERDVEGSRYGCGEAGDNGSMVVPDNMGGSEGVGGGEEGEDENEGVDESHWESTKEREKKGENLSKI